MIVVTPNFPPQEDGCFKFLASVGLTELQLENSCVKKARVTGVFDRQHINIMIDDEEYTEVPVWIHTDIGARLALLRGEELVEPSDYFKDAALMFPFPGLDEDSYPYVHALTSFNPDTEELEVHGVIGILRNFYAPNGATINTQSAVIPRTVNAAEITKGFPTYRPFLYFTLDQNDDPTAFVSLFDLEANDFASIPVYVAGEPTATQDVADLVAGMSTDNIAQFLSGAVIVGDGDCFASYAATAGTAWSHGGVQDETYSFLERDTGTPITGTRVSTDTVRPETTVWSGDEFTECTNANSWPYGEPNPIPPSAIQDTDGERVRITAVAHSLVSFVASETPVQYDQSHYVYDMYYGLNPNQPQFIYSECHLIGTMDNTISSMRGLEQTALEVDFCKTNLYDVYTSAFVSYGTTNNVIRSYTYDIYNVYQGISDGFILVSTEQSINPLVIVAGGSVMRPTGLFNQSLTSVLLQIGALITNPARGGDYYYLGARVDSVKLYLVPYDPRIDLLTGTP